MNKNEFKNSKEYADIFQKLLNYQGVSIGWIQRQWKLSFDEARTLYEETKNYYDKDYLNDISRKISRFKQPVTTEEIMCYFDVSNSLAAQINKFYKEYSKTDSLKERLEEVSKELNLNNNDVLFREGTYLAYLKFVREYLINISTVYKIQDFIIRLTNESALDAWLLGIKDEIEVVKNYAIASTSDAFFVEDRVVKINLSLPKYEIEEAKEILLINKNVYQIKENLFEVMINKNKKYKYQLQFLDSSLLDHLMSTTEFWTKLEKPTHYKDKETLDYMFHEDIDNPNIPHLYGVVNGNPGDYYELMKEVKVKSVDDLAKIDCALWSNYKNKNKLIRCFKDLNFDFTLYSKENAFFLLTEMYMIDKFEAYRLINSLGERDDFNERDELMLGSHGVPDYIIYQLENIKYLHFLATSAQNASVYYDLAYCKLRFQNWANFHATNIDPNKNKFVGPFFYINNELLFEREMIRKKNLKTRFVNADKSHFALFNELKIEGEYSDYPRGRVIYDRKHHFFRIYIDKSIDKKEIIDEILKTYSIEKKKSIVLYDEHYTHEGE